MMLRATLLTLLLLSSPGSLGATSLSTKDFIRFNGVARTEPAAQQGRFAPPAAASWLHVAMISLLGVVAVGGMWSAVRTTRRSLKRRRKTWRRRRGHYKVRW